MNMSLILEIAFGIWLGGSALILTFWGLFEVYDRSRFNRWGLRE